uniref:Uncharacterized protein n=1 Tax=Pyricularia oryzae (strain 70-15 / ATCC MYA-4617 / FGSC 8958) TaxID=242507 RepID=Q2KFN8_PYRO7|nr:hypothetical protein MGCH7_ch7g647 [Pyricularia oryzae 70-15]
MVQPTRPPANGFVAFCRKIYNPIGFSKGYNFILFFIFGGALMGFSLARMPYLDYWGTFQRGKRSEKAAGGTVDTQTATGFLAVVFVGALAMSYYNVKRLQIEQHRAWMLRAWAYAGAIVTMRLIFVVMIFVNSARGYSTVRECSQVDYEMEGDRDRVLRLFPGCEGFYSGEDEHAVVIVDANMGGNAATVGSALVLSFGAALWLATAIHMIGVEIYLMLTPAEHERLRNVSYQRQLEAGMKNPGRAGLTVDRFGDAEKWIPESQRKFVGQQSVENDSDAALNER